MGSKARSHLLSPPRRAGVGPSPLQPGSCPSWDTGTASAPAPVPPLFAVGWERYPGRQRTSSAAKAGLGSAQLRGAQAAISGEGWGSRAHTAKGRRREAASLIPTGPFPGLGDTRQSLAISPNSPLTPSKLHTYFGVLRGPQQGWGATARNGEWTVKSRAYGTLLEMGREGPPASCPVPGTELAGSLGQEGSKLQGMRTCFLQCPQGQKPALVSQGQHFAPCVYEGM